MIAHKWQPIQPADAEVERYDFSEIDSLQRQWLNIRARQESANPDAYKSFLERLGRSWAIETGIIEGLYTLDRGVTETLIARGIAADYIEPSSTNREPQDLVRVLNDHQESIDFVYQYIRAGHPLTRSFMTQLHQVITKNQSTYLAVNQFGQWFDAILDKGVFKKHPNNPTRPDGSIHEYCPPEQVESELDNLEYFYNELQQDKSVDHPLLTDAWLHHTFTQIHPFQDGNGRVARALLTWHLAKEGFLPVVISRDDRAKYIEALELADGSALNPFIDLTVQLEKRTILQALGEPEPVAQSGLVDQVVGHIVEQIRLRNREREAQMRSVNLIAGNLRDIAEIYLEEVASGFSKRLNENGMSVRPFIFRGGPGEREHWYREEVIRTANNAKNWANLNESRYFVRLSLDNDLTDSDTSRHPRLVFVVSLHHVGRELSGIMAATAFALIEHYPDDEGGETQATGTPYFRDCTVNPFTFTWQSDAEAITPGFTRWVEEHLGIALSYWQGFLT